MARGVRIPSSFYDNLAEIADSPIGRRLREVRHYLCTRKQFSCRLRWCVFSDSCFPVSTKVNLDETQRAWKSACTTEGEKAESSSSSNLNLEDAESLCYEETKDSQPVVRHDKRWFCGMFCDGRGLEREMEDSVWDLVKTPAPTEALALLACVPALIERFYKPETHFVQPAIISDAIEDGMSAVQHLVIGAAGTLGTEAVLSQFLLATLRRGVGTNVTGCNFSSRRCRVLCFTNVATHRAGRSVTSTARHASIDRDYRRGPRPRRRGQMSKVFLFVAFLTPVSLLLADDNRLNAVTTRQRARGL